MAEKLGQALLELSTTDTGLEEGIGRAEERAFELERQFKRTERSVDDFAVAERGAAAATETAAAAMELQQQAARATGHMARNLSFQLIDIAQSIPLAFQAPTAALQNLGFQMAQIGQIYMGQGGMRAALKDSIGLVGSFAARLGPAAIAVGLVAGALVGLQHEINDTSDVTVGLGDTATAVFQVMASAIYDYVRPAVEAMAPWFAAAWDLIVAGVKWTGNTFIATWRTTIDGVKTAVDTVPAIFEAAFSLAAARALNTVFDLAYGVGRTIDGVAETMNATFGTEFGTGAMSGVMERLNSLIAELDGRTAEATAKIAGAWQDWKARAAQAFAADPLGDFFDAVSQRAAENARAGLDETGEAASRAGKAVRKLGDDGKVAFRAMADRAQETAGRFDELGRSLLDPLKQALTSGEFRVKSFADAVLGILSDMTSRLLDIVFRPIEDAISRSLGGFLEGVMPGLFGHTGFSVGATPSLSGALPDFSSVSLTGFASGGWAEGWAMVGEKGPEPVYLGQGGRVFSNDSLRQAVGGGTVVNVYAPPGSQVREERSQSGGIEQVNLFIQQAVARGINTPGSPIQRALSTGFGARPVTRQR